MPKATHPRRAISFSLCVPNIPTYQLSLSLSLSLKPLPDTSMPFNVLSMTCTLYAFVVGSVMSLLIRKASQTIKYELDPASKPKSKVELVREKVKGALGKLRAKLRGSNTAAASAAGPTASLAEDADGAAHEASALADASTEKEET
jgi:hypothetical protein